MASREERMQQRLRGAQRRQVKDVDFGDFGIVFGAPAAPHSPDVPTQSEPLAEDAPQPKLPSDAPPSSKRKTPSRYSISANTSAKRRRVDTNVGSSSSRSTRSARPVPRPDIYTLVDDAPPAIPDPITTRGLIRRDSQQDAISRPVEEPRLIPATLASPPLPVTGTWTPKSGTPASLSEAFADSNGRLEDAPDTHMKTSMEKVDTPTSSRKRKQRETGPKSAAKQRPRTETYLSAIDEPDESSPSNTVAEEQMSGTAIDKLSPVFQPRRSQRFGTALDELSPKVSAKNKQIRVDTNDDFSPDVIVRRRRQPKAAAAEAPEWEGPSPAGSSDEHEEAEAIDDAQAAAIMKKSRGRKAHRRISIDVPPVEASTSNSPMVSKRRKKYRAVPSPVQQRHPKAKSLRKTKTPKPGKEPRPQRGSPIPVTVHRLSKPLIYEDDELDADILNAEIPHARLSGVNLMDVLSQVCQEIITTGLDSLEARGNNEEDPALRREYKTKWNAVAAFGEVIKSRFLEHTISLDNLHALKRRVRDEHKRRLKLREDILRVRAEREQVALRMDEIRAKHESEKTKAQIRDELNTAIHDVEMSVELGKAINESDDHEMIGTEVLLKRVAGEVSNRSHSGGFLNRIKEFNVFLERAAGALEGRKV